MLKEGDKAPAFNLADQDGNKHKLSDYKGKWVVLFAYPRANTSGCTKEAIAFTGLVKKFEKSGAVVLGISPDAPAKLAKFRDKHDLGFTLLSDPDHAVADAYGVWGEKSMYGKKYFGIIRSAFLVDESGKISHAWPKISPKDTPKNLLKALAEG